MIGSMETQLLSVIIKSSIIKRIFALYWSPTNFLVHRFHLLLPFCLYLKYIFMRCVYLPMQLNQWPQSVSARFQYRIYPISFSVGDAEEWKKLFKPCAAQRLFLPVRPQHSFSSYILNMLNVTSRLASKYFFSLLEKHIVFPAPAINSRCSLWI